MRRATIGGILAIAVALFSSLFLASVSGAAIANAIGTQCLDQYLSATNVLDLDNNAVVNATCFPSKNDSSKFVWSVDSNIKLSSQYPPTPAISFGRTGPSVCPTRITADNEPFVQDFGDTTCRTDNVLGGTIWWSQNYADSITAATYVQPVIVDETDENIPVAPAEIKDPSIADFSITKVTSLGLAIGAYLGVSLSATAMLQSGLPVPAQNAPQVEKVELLGRKERKFSLASRPTKLLRSLFTLDGWSFFTQKVPRLIRRVGQFSTPTATILGDADYLRASIGSFSFLLYPLGIILGFKSFVVDNHLPTALGLTLMIVLGCIDSLAGAMSAATFSALVIFSDNTVQTRELYVSLIVIFTLATGPALFAGALRRFDGVHTKRKGRWERMVDYALSPLLTAWIVWKVVDALAVRLESAEIEDYALQIALVTGVIIALRYFLEAFVAKHFTGRINEIVAETVPMGKWFQVTQYFRKGAWAWLFAGLFFGYISTATLVLIGLVILPGLLKALGAKPSERFTRLNVIGAPRLAIISSIGLALTFFASSTSNRSLNLLYLILGLTPVLFFSAMEALSESHITAQPFFYETQKGRYLYRLGAIALYLLILCTIAVSVLNK